MLSREEILRTPEYWFEHAQNQLYRQVTEFMKKEGINQTQLAEKLGVSKGYVSQILKGEFNYTLKKLIELSIALGKVPAIEYKALDEVVADDDIPIPHSQPSGRNGRRTKLRVTTHQQSPARSGG